MGTNGKTRAGVLSVVATLLCACARADEAILSIEARIPLGEIGGRIDHLALDSGRQRLFVAELGNDSIGIVNLANRKTIRTIAGLKEPQGIAYVASVDRIYVASGGDGSVRMFNAADFSDAGRIALGDDADNIRVDGKNNRVYVGYGSGALAVIDPASGKKIDDIPLKGHPESFQLETAGTRIFVNVPGAHRIEVIDHGDSSKRSSLPVAALRANFPMALDEPRHRLFVVFRQPATVALFDSIKDAAPVTIDSCGDADDVFVDHKRSRIYVACGEGFVDAFDVDDTNLTRVARLATVHGARTAMYDEAADRLLLAVRADSSNKAEIWIIRVQ